MLCKTRGIVLHSIPYNDKYSIIYMYTEAFGRASYLVARSRGKKSSVSKALFMPLSVVELRLLHYLGIYPNVESYVAGSCFDMLNGVFVDRIPMHRHYLNRQESVVFARLLKISFENMSLYSFSRQDRVSVINRILEYYRLHLPDFPEIKSLSVMQSLFD